MREIYSVLLNLKTTPKNTPMVCAETMCVQAKSIESPEEMKQADDDVSPSVEAKSEDDFNSEDDGSPRGVLEMCASDSHCDSPSSIDKALIPVVAAAEGHNRLHWRKVIAAIKKKSFSAISKRSLPAAAAPHPTIHFEAPSLTNKPSWTTFNYHQLAAATANFSAENLIGKGGHAEVYKGQLSDGQLVAVKRLTRKQNEEERTGDFLSELGIIAHIDHPNAARLLGFGVDGGLHLVLQFSPNGSLASLLHGTEGCLDWGVRFRVALGVAQGLNYLHKGCHRRIIHRDIKASNILLTKDYEPQISDFGLAKWLPEQWAHHIVFPIEGTFGYLAPEYFMHGIIDEKTDVFAFGVLLLELITGRRAVDSSQLSLVLWSKPLLDTNNVKELIDPRLGDAYDLAEMKNVIFTASMCIHHLSTRRPNMTRVGQLLKGVNGSLEVMGREQKPHIGRALMLDSCDLEDYTCSTYLKDLNRHRKLALE